MQDQREDYCGCSLILGEVGAGDKGQVRQCKVWKPKVAAGIDSGCSGKALQGVDYSPSPRLWHSSSHHHFLPLPVSAPLPVWSPCLCSYTARVPPPNQASIWTNIHQCISKHTFTFLWAKIQNKSSWCVESEFSFIVWTTKKPTLELDTILSLLTVLGSEGMFSW